MKNWKEIKTWWYEFKNGHPFLLSKEVDIIITIRSEERCMWMNDTQIQQLVKRKVSNMYRNKYPNAKQFDFKKLLNQFTGKLPKD